MILNLLDNMKLNYSSYDYNISSDTLILLSGWIYLLLC